MDTILACDSHPDIRPLLARWRGDNTGHTRPGRLTHELRTQVYAHRHTAQSRQVETLLHECTVSLGGGLGLKVVPCSTRSLKDSKVCHGILFSFEGYYSNILKCVKSLNSLYGAYMMTGTSLEVLTFLVKDQAFKLSLALGKTVLCSKANVDV